MQSSRRKFLYAATAATALGGIFESGCKKEPRRLAVLLHGMMILDIRGLTIKAFMPMVPCPMPKGQDQHGDAAPAKYAHDYCVTPDSKIAHEINLVPKTVKMAQYLLAGVGADRGKPVFLPDQHILLKGKSPEDLCVNTANIVACMELPFPDRVVPLRQAHKNGGGSITTGGDATKYNAQPTSMPLVYAMVYDLVAEEKPFIVGTDGGRLWSQTTALDHVHVHAEPENRPIGHHFPCLAAAFCVGLDLDVYDQCATTANAPDSSALGVPVPEVELWGLPGPPTVTVVCGAAKIGCGSGKTPCTDQKTPPAGGGKDATTNVGILSDDPGNCASVVVDDGSGN